MLSYSSRLSLHGQDACLKNANATGIQNVSPAKSCKDKCIYLKETKNTQHHSKEFEVKFAMKLTILMVILINGNNDLKDFDKLYKFLAELTRRLVVIDLNLINAMNFYLLKVYKNIDKFKAMKLQKERGVQGKSEWNIFSSSKRLIMSCLLITVKYWHDEEFSMELWSKVTGLKPKAIRSLEFELIRFFNFEFYIRHDDFDSWSGLFASFYDANNHIEDKGFYFPNANEVNKTFKPGSAFTSFNPVLRSSSSQLSTNDQLLSPPTSPKASDTKQIVSLLGQENHFEIVLSNTRPIEEKLLMSMPELHQFCATIDGTFDKEVLHQLALLLDGFNASQQTTDSFSLSGKDEDILSMSTSNADGSNVYATNSKRTRDDDSIENYDDTTNNTTDLGYGTKRVKV